MKKLLLLLFVSIGINSAAEDDLAEYMDNGLPIYYQLLDGKTRIYIEFTDVIQGRYIVDVEWFPNWGLVPMFNGPANINFNLILLPTKHNELIKTIYEQKKVIITT